MSFINFTLYVTWFLILCLLGYLAYTFLLKENKKEDRNIGINFMFKRSGGRFIGEEVEIEDGVEGRRIIRFKPLDISEKDKRENKEIPFEKVIIEKNKILSIPKGGASKDKNINIYLPKDSTFFPDNLKHHPFGKLLMQYTEIVNSDNSELDSLKECITRQASHMKTFAKGEATIEAVTRLTNFYKDIIDIAKESKKDKPSTPININPQN